MLVENEFLRTEARLERDTRLIAAVGAIVDHAAYHAGMGDVRRSSLARAAELMCRDVWPAPRDGDPAMEVTCDQYGDRVEVAIQGGGTPDAKVEAALEKFRKQLDRVSTENRAGKLRITLVEYLSPRQ